MGGQAELIDETVGRVLPLLQSEAEELDSRDFTEEEVGQYVNAIVDVLSDEAAYTRMCAACRERIETGFSSQLMIQKLESIFEELVHDCASVENRKRISAELRKYLGVCGELVTAMSEIESYEFMYKNTHTADTKNELMRIANSKWGRRLIKVAFRLRVNKLFQ